MKKKWKNKSDRAIAGVRHGASALFIAFTLIGCSRENHQIAPEQLTMTPELAMAAKSPNEAVLASVRTIHPKFGATKHSVEGNGVVTYDTRRIYAIAARVAGRLEKVYLKYAYQQVFKGEKIAEMYSAELFEAQRELLFLIQNDRADDALIAGAQKKLQLLGMSSAQIEVVIKTNEILKTVGLFSPFSGYLLPQANIAPSIADPQEPMREMAKATANEGVSAIPATQSFVREGDYVSAGQTLFRIADTRALRIDFNLPASTSGTVTEGDELDVILDDGTKRAAVAGLVQPFFNEGENFSRVRVYVDDANGLQIGQLVKATISLRGTESLWLPREAVLELGTREVVFVSERGMLKPKVVATGIRTDDMIEITSGLASIDAVAENAHFLVDSEGFVKPIN